MRVASFAMAVASIGLMVGATITSAAVITTNGNTYTDTSAGLTPDATTADYSGGNLLIKTNTNNASNRVAWMNFDRTAAESTITKATVGLTVALQGGTATYTFNLYGIPDLDAKDGFNPSTTNYSNSSGSYVTSANNSPASAKIGTVPTLLASSTVTSPGVGGSTVFASTPELVNFINADTTGTVSFLVAVNSGGTGAWSVTGLNTSAAAAPVLRTNVDAVPEPGALAGLGLFVVGLIRRNRRPV